MPEPKDPPQPEPAPMPVDSWGLPAATTHMDEPQDIELGVECAEDPDEAW